MIVRGFVNRRREAILAIKIHGTQGKFAEIEAVVDTGYTGTVVLPMLLVNDLELRPQSSGSAVLADGTVSRFDTYFAHIEWDGKLRKVTVSAVGDETLIGMKFLSGCELRVKVEPGGFVEVHK